MKKALKNLIETNPYLKDVIEREARIAKNVRKSSALEGFEEISDEEMDKRFNDNVRPIS